MVYQIGTPKGAAPDASEYWRRNLTVCLLGSFTTVFAMTLMLPFLPLYVEQLGVQGRAAIIQWAGVAYACAFVTAGLAAPLWGHLGDRFGRKPMLVRASLGMAIAMALMGLASNLWQLIVLRLLVGLAGGYSSGASILIAVQAPKDRSAWALGTLSVGVMAGSLIGPLAGGSLPALIGIRGTFWIASFLILLAFVGTVVFIREAPHKSQARATVRSSWSAVPAKDVVIAMLVTGLLLLLAGMSIEPVITVYVATLIHDPSQVTFVSGLAMAAAALGSILSAPRLGRLADRIGHFRVITLALVMAAALLIPQAFVTGAWQLIGLRFLMGITLGGLMPCIASVLRHSVPDDFVGTVMGYSISSQYLGQVVGPLVGGFIGAHLGMRAVFISTAGLLLLGALHTWRVAQISPHTSLAIRA